MGDGLILDKTSLLIHFKLVKLLMSRLLYCPFGVEGVTVRSALFTTYRSGDPTAESGTVDDAAPLSRPVPARDVAVGADAASVMSHYLQDVRQYPLLTHEHELALAQQIQEGGRVWRQAFVQSLLVVPDLLACRARVRRGGMDVTALCEDELACPPETALPRLDRLHALRREMGRVTRAEGAADRAAALRDDMRGLIQSVPWDGAMLQRARLRLHVAMTSNAVCRARQARRYRESLGYSLATLHDLWAHLEDLHGRAETAKQELTTRNLRLVISVAREFMHTGVPLTDLVQEGNIGLMRAVNKFDYQRNLKFSTYAVWWIKQAIRRAVYEQMALIRVPEYMYESARQVQKLIPILTIELGRAPTPHEMAQRLDLPLERVERSLALTHEPVSLDQTPMGERERPFQERVADTEAVQGVEMVLQHDLQQHTQQALACLKPREAEVLRRRFGLDGHPGETLRQIGLDLELSHERVRQIEAQALAKLKAERPGLRDYLEV